MEKPRKQRQGNPVTCFSIDEPWQHYTKWNKAVMKR